MSTAAASLSAAARTGIHDGHPAAGADQATLASTLRFELVKMVAPRRVQLVALACLLGPAAFIGAVGLQDALPADTVFGRWMTQSGWAAALVVLAFACSWILPLLTCLVAGDAFSSEDRLGTWRHLVMAVRNPRRIFTAKAVASVLVIEAMVAALATSAIVGGLLLVGTHPLVTLSGEAIGTGRAAQLVLLAWASAAVGTLTFAAIGLLGSVLMGRSPMGLLLPAVACIGFQLAQMLPMPTAVRMALPSQLFVAWRGLFTHPSQMGPWWAGLAVSLVWTVVVTLLARALFLRRDFTDLAYDGATRRAMLAGLLPLLGLLVAGCLAMLPLAPAQGQGVTRQKLEVTISETFSNLYRLQADAMGRPVPTVEQMQPSTACDRGGVDVEDEGPGNDWRCVVSWHLPGATATGRAIYQVDVAPDGRVVADGDGPVAVNGYFQVDGPTGRAANPLWQVDSLVDLLAPH